MTDHKTLNDSDISNPEYRTFVYNKIDGKVVSQIVDAPKSSLLQMLYLKLCTIGIVKN